MRGHAITCYNLGMVVHRWAALVKLQINTTDYEYFQIYTYKRAGSEQQRRNIMDWFSLTDKYHLQHGNYWVHQFNYNYSTVLDDFTNQNYNYMINCN